MLKTIKKFFSCLRSDPIDTVADLQDQRALWLVMAFTGLILEQIAYQVFQKWLFMPPCEQCVYIRFSMVCLFIAGILGAIKPKVTILKLLAYLIAFYGTIKGLIFSYKLRAIHAAVHGDDPFGVQGCSAVPTFPFNLPLHEWFPSTFLPTGDCGYDNPIIPTGTELSYLQQVLTDYWDIGWYLIPKYHFMNMAEAMLLCFAVVFMLLAVCFSAYIIRNVRKIKSRRA